MKVEKRTHIKTSEGILEISFDDNNIIFKKFTFEDNIVKSDSFSFPKNCLADVVEALIDIQNL